MRAGNPSSRLISQGCVSMLSDSLQFKPSSSTPLPWRSASCSHLWMVRYKYSSTAQQEPERCWILSLVTDGGFRQQSCSYFQAVSRLLGLGLRCDTS